MTCRRFSDIKTIRNEQVKCMDHINRKKLNREISSIWEHIGCVIQRKHMKLSKNKLISQATGNNKRKIAFIHILDFVKEYRTLVNSHCSVGHPMMKIYEYLFPNNFRELIMSLWPQIHTGKLPTAPSCIGERSAN